MPGEADHAARMSAALVAGLLAGYGIAVPVGAVGAYLVALTARTSWRIGACAALGVATADGLYALVATAGGSALAPAIRSVTAPLHWASAAVLLALACHGAASALAEHRAGRATGGGTRTGGGTCTGGDARAHDGRPDRSRAGAARAYLGLLGITLMNPVTVIYFAALVLAGQGSTVVDRWDKAAFVAAAFAASASWQSLLAGGGALLGRALTGPRGRLCTSLLSSTVIAGLAFHLLCAPS